MSARCLLERRSQSNMIATQRGQAGDSRISVEWTTGRQSKGGRKGTFPDLKHTKSILQNDHNLAHSTRLHFWHLGNRGILWLVPTLRLWLTHRLSVSALAGTQRNQLRTHRRHHRDCRRRRRPRPRQKGTFFAPIRLVRRQDLFDNRKTFQNGCKWLELEADHDGNGCLRCCVGGTNGMAGELEVMDWTDWKVETARSEKTTDTQQLWTT